MEEFIAYDTAAATRDREYFPGDVGGALILDVASTFTGTETIPVYYVGKDKVRTTPVLNEDGEPFAFSATQKVLPIFFSCRLRVAKGITAQAMGITQCGRV
jgi:hypothetical protein